MRSRAFTIIEVIVVVVVLGILAAVAVPRFLGAQQDTSVAAAAEDLKAIELALDMYHATNAAYPPDVNRTKPVSQLDPYFKIPNPFAKPCPIGGVYDWEGPPEWNPVQVSIRNDGTNTFKPELAQALDEHFDDGNLATGRFRQEGADRLAFYVEAD